MKKRSKWLLVVFVITVVVSVFVFIKYKGYEGMFDSFKKDKSDTTIVETIKEPTPIKIEPTIDTIYIYRVIVGSFKSYKNAKRLSETIPFSDVIETYDGWYRVSKNYYFNYEDAKNERNSLGSDTWVMIDYIFFEN